jgi:hypothetical protein
LAFAVLSAPGARAQSPDELALCRAIEDDARRLACYDAIHLSTASPLSKYTRMSLEDLKLDILTSRGRFVEVAGVLRASSGALSLGVDAADERPLPIDVEALPRQDRRALLDECTEGCNAIVQGRVNPVRFTTGIVADRVIRR